MPRANTPPVARAVAAAGRARAVIMGGRAGANPGSGRFTRTGTRKQRPRRCPGRTNAAPTRKSGNWWASVPARCSTPASCRSDVAAVCRCVGGDTHPSRLTAPPPATEEEPDTRRRPSPHRRAPRRSRCRRVTRRASLPAGRVRRAAISAAAASANAAATACHHSIYSSFLRRPPPPCVPFSGCEGAAASLPSSLTTTRTKSSASNTSARVVLGNRFQKSLIVATSSS